MTSFLRTLVRAVRDRVAHLEAGIARLDELSQPWPRKPTLRKN